MKTAFCTSVQIGLSCIESIYRSGGTIDLLITLQDKKLKNSSGRIYLDKFAFENHIPLLKVNHINDPEVAEILSDMAIDWMFIIGWSQIASERVVNAPKKGSIGAHPTLLPKGRGRAAIPWTIIKDLRVSGVTFFKLDQGVDTGPIILQKVIHVDPKETASTLYEKVNNLHIDMVAEVYSQMKSESLAIVEQNEADATYWEGRKPIDGEIFPSMTTKEVDTLVRATTQPYPGAYLIRDNQKYIIWEGKIGTHPKAKMTVNCSDGDYSVLKYEQEDLSENIRNERM